MAVLPKPTKPLNILTIDGGGLQGISTLLVLDKLLNAIARNNRKPRPCDVFDVIAGIGAGGWLALLLGRFQMDVSAALAEWYNLIDCITPRSKTEELRMRLKHRYFDTERLVEQIDQLTEFYETDKHMFFTPPQGTRCKHVFVSALKDDSRGKPLGYTLFRTYHCPEGSNVLEGPAADIREYKISHAFGATGAAKYFTPPWKEPSSKKVKLKFLDTYFPRAHNITELALNEIWGLYGDDVKISVVVNIGPGTPNASDYRNIARRFSWGKQAPTTSSQTRKKIRFSGLKDVTTDSKGAQFPQHQPTDIMPHDESKTSHRVNFDKNLPAPAANTERKTSAARHSTFGSEKNVGIEEKLQRDEEEVEDDIRRKLRNVYKENPPPYYRLGPSRSAPGTTQNDTCSPKVSFNATKLYLDGAERYVKEAGQCIAYDISLPA